MEPAEKLLLAHQKASADAWKWTEKAVELRESGHTRKAKEAEKKALECLRKAREIEVYTRRPNPHA